MSMMEGPIGLRDVVTTQIEDERHGGMAVLDALLRRASGAVVAALGPGAAIVPMPVSLARHGHAAFEGRLGLDLVAAEDQVLIVDGWARAQHQLIVRFDVHLLANPDRLTAVHLSTSVPSTGCTCSSSKPRTTNRC